MIVVHSPGHKWLIRRRPHKRSSIAADAYEFLSEFFLLRHTTSNAFVRLEIFVNTSNRLCQ